MTPFGNYLEHLRRSRGLIQKQLAHYMGIDPCYVSALEKGKKGPPSNKILEKLIKSLELTQQEQEKLWEYVELSQLNRKLPSGISLQEYSLIKQLWGKLGSLTEEQIIIMSTALKMKQGTDNSQPKWRF